VFAHEMEFETANQKEKVSAMENSKRRCWKPKAKRGSQKTRSRGEKSRINEGGNVSVRDERLGWHWVFEGSRMETRVEVISVVDSINVQVKPCKTTQSVANPAPSFSSPLKSLGAGDYTVFRITWDCSRPA